MATCLTLMAWTGNAQSHGYVEPKHGGVIDQVDELDFELVQEPEGAALHIEDHGAPIRTQGAGGTLTMRGGSRESTTRLVPAGDGKLLAIGARLTKGSTVVAVVWLPNQVTVTARFMVERAEPETRERPP